MIFSDGSISAKRFLGGIVVGLYGKMLCSQALISIDLETAEGRNYFMEKDHFRILLIDDDEDDYLLVKGMLSGVRSKVSISNGPGLTRRGWQPWTGVPTTHTFWITGWVSATEWNSSVRRSQRAAMRQ